MAWRGFLKESKSYMAYPHCGHFHFWFRFPVAAFKYYWATLKSWRLYNAKN